MRWRRRPAVAEPERWCPPQGEFILAHGGDLGRVEVWDLNEVPWNEAPLPPVEHDCYAQTKGWVDYFTYIERCACGAIRHGDWNSWIGKNERRRP